VVEAMSEHYHEHHESIMAWSWRFFCRKWVRLIIWMGKEQAKQHEQQQQQEFERLKQLHTSVHGG